MTQEQTLESNEGEHQAKSWGKNSLGKGNWPMQIQKPKGKSVNGVCNKRKPILGEC